MQKSVMEPSASGELEYHQSQLIGGLPDDIALFCLARVPRRYHTVLKCVSKRWRDLVCSEEWRLYRQKHSLDETWIYALRRDKFLGQVSCYCLDPSSSRRSWKLIQGMPARCSKRKGSGFQTLGKKVYLLGGCGQGEDATDEVYCYDVSMNTWDEAPSLSIPRCYFACEVAQGKIYAIGGLGSKSSDPRSWDTYDPHTNSWTSHSDPNVVPDIEDSVVLDGKVYIRCSASAVSSHVYVVIYEPLSGIWQHGEADMATGWRGPAIVVDQTLYVLDQSSGIKLMKWRKETRDWVAIGRLSPLLTRPPCGMVAIGKNIFIIGKGLSTVVFDVSNLGDSERVMVGSSIPNLDSDDDVISCKSLSI